jgi:hypothetical protein
LELKTQEAGLAKYFGVIVLQDVDEQVNFDHTCSGTIECLELTEELLVVDHGASGSNFLVNLAKVVSLAKLCE